MPLICRSAVTVKLPSAFSPGLQFRVIRDSDKVISGFLYSIFPAAIRSSFARMDVPLLPPQTRLSIFSWVFIAFF